MAGALVLLAGGVARWVGPAALQAGDFRRPFGVSSKRCGRCNSVQRGVTVRCGGAVAYKARRCNSLDGVVGFPCEGGGCFGRSTATSTGGFGSGFKCGFKVADAGRAGRCRAHVAAASSRRRRDRARGFKPTRVADGFGPTTFLRVPWRPWSTTPALCHAGRQPCGTGVGGACYAAGGVAVQSRRHPSFFFLWVTGNDVRGKPVLGRFQS